MFRIYIFLGNFYFDLEADLTELFHWNNKQLFIYIMGKGPFSTVFHFSVASSLERFMVLSQIKMLHHLNSKGPF